MAAPLLDGIRVVDIASGIAGPVATMLLAEAGADVVKVEPPEENPDRSLPGFRTWNRSKRSVVLDLESPDGLEGLHRLLAAADVFVHQFTPLAAQKLGLDDAALTQRHPQLIVTSVLGWPANHPDAERGSDELLAMARMGICDEQFAMARSEGPVYIRFPLGSWGAAYLAAIGILARLHAREITGLGGPAHTSLVQGALVPMGMHWTRAERPSPVLAAGFPKEEKGSQATVFECADGGWIHLMPDPTRSPYVAARVAEGRSLTEIFLSRPRAETLEDLWSHDAPVQPCLAMGDVLEDEQARVNGYVIELDDPEYGPITVPGNPLTTDPPCEVRWPAPAHGAHTAEVAAQWATPVSKPKRAGGGGLRSPLEGLKVLDFGSYLAGPYGPMLLADLGADVIKVEATTGDGMRPGDWAFAGCQRGKRNVSLDLKSPQARPALESLIKWADVVHHNIRMPAARRLGLDADSVRAINPTVVFCHTSSYGPLGERTDWPGYDQLFQAQCGWEVAGAGQGNPPMWHRFGFMDHQCAMSSIVSTLLALRRRDATGVGQVAAGSLLGPGVLTTSETFRLANGQLVPFPTLDHDQTGVSVGRRIISTSGGWVAVAADRADQIDALCQVAGVDDATKVPDALASRPIGSVVAALEAAGVPVEVVREQNRDPFLDDPANRSARLVAEYPHAEWGTIQQTGGMWYLGDMDLVLDRAPAVLGEHTVEVLTEMGWERAAIDELIASGAAVQY